jgi:hypothetical protein
MTKRRASKIAIPSSAPKARAVPRQKKTPNKKLKSLNSMFFLPFLIGFNGLFSGLETANIPTLFVERGPDNVTIKLPFSVHLKNALFLVGLPIHRIHPSRWSR